MLLSFHSVFFARLIYFLSSSFLSVEISVNVLLWARGWVGISFKLLWSEGAELNLGTAARVSWGVLVLFVKEGFLVDINHIMMLLSHDPLHIKCERFLSGVWW